MKVVTVGTVSEFLNDEVVIVKRSNELQNFALGVWLTSGLFTASQMGDNDTVIAAGGGTFYTEMEPLSATFQDIALGLGILSALAGFILLGFKKRWGEVTLKTTALVVGGVFLVPSILMLIGIVGTLLNDALTTAFENVRGAENIKGVMGE